MSGSAVQVVGVTELTRALEGLVASFNSATRVATAQASHLLEREIKTKLTTSSHPRGTPTPSSPGEPPSLVTGTLRRSITVKGPVPLGTGRWEAQIGPTVVYGRIQELGGVTGRRGATELPPRPYVRPAYERLAVTGALTSIYHSAWRAALNRH
ncbi:phage virion morphogenesis protein [Streptomyces sp. YIM S03343]